MIQTDQKSSTNLKTQNEFNNYKQALEFTQITNRIAGLVFFKLL